MFKKTHKTNFLTLSLLSLGIILGGCGFGAKDEILPPTSLISSDIFSLESVNPEVVMFMVRLKTPALLASGLYDENGEIQISDYDKQVVLKEQQDFIAAAKKLSSDLKVIYTTKLVMNSLTIVAPPDIYEALNKLPMVRNTQKVEIIEPPTPMQRQAMTEELKNTLLSLKTKNSVNFMGVDRVQEEMKITGKGLKIGVIDTGIDYTHAMFGGPGTRDVYQSIDENEATEQFPTQKVIGGIDLVGSNYTPGSPVKELKIPRPDSNPLDTQGHGTHVAGTIAGIATDDNSYSGVLPDAKLYAIKVFGKTGTGDAVVIAALEYALDPNGDLDPKDRLDVVNLSLGGIFGKGAINYTEAIANASKAGVAVVTAAGNSGAVPFVVGAPSTVETAFSIAAGIDDMGHNWRFEGAKVGDQIVQSVSSAFTKKLAVGEELTGDVVYVGLAATDFDEETLAKIPGKIALIDRGINNFVDKVTRAKAAGALAVVVGNNEMGAAPSIMGGADNDAPKLDILASMVSFEVAASMKVDLLAGKTVSFTFSDTVKFEKPELIDTITSFSSRGPRSEDGLIKPEIVAPGSLIVSAKSGSGTEYEQMSGTSMSSPHMAGVMGIMKERYPNLTVRERKNLLMSTAVAMKIPGGSDALYPVAMQGAGRVDVFRAVNAKLLLSKGGLSLGQVNIARNKKILSKLNLKNISDENLELRIESNLARGPNYSLALAQTGATFTIPKGREGNIDLNFIINVEGHTRLELDGFVKFVNARNGELEAHIPVLAIINNISNVKSENLVIEAPDVMTQFGASASFKTKNNSSIDSGVYPFNLLGVDVRKPYAGDLRHIRSTSCDLKSVGYKIIKKTDRNGDETEVLQFGVKLYQAVSNWQMCDISVLFDGNNDGIPEQELAATNIWNIPGLGDTFPGVGYASVLIDMSRAKMITGFYESMTRAGMPWIRNYVQAVVDLAPFYPFPMSSLAILEIPTEKLVRTESGDLRVKISVHHEDYLAIESIDYLGDENTWHTISLDANDQSFVDLPEEVIVNAGQSKTVAFTKGAGNSPLVIYVPTNKESLSKNDPDLVEQILDAIFR